MPRCHRRHAAPAAGAAAPAAALYHRDHLAACRR